MNLKDRMVKKLLSFGKKHRILVYPTLVLIAIISAVSNAVYWGRGNGKKLVASVMVMAMLITQSVFLTSSAEGGNPDNGDLVDAGTDLSDPDGGIAPLSLDYSNYTVSYYRVDEKGDTHMVHVGADVILKDGEDGQEITDYKIAATSGDNLIEYMFADDLEQKNHISIDGYYLDPACEESIGDGTLQSSWVAANNTYKIYFKATRNSYPFEIADSKSNISTVTGTLAVTPEEGNIYPQANYTVKQAADYDYYMTGYRFAGLKFDGIHYAVGTDVIVTSDNKISRIYLSIDWEAMKNKVSFDAIGSDAPADAVVNSGNEQIKKLEYTYGSEQMLPTAEEFWAKSDAYVLSGWRYNDTVFSITNNVDTTLLFDPVTNVKADPNIEGRTLTAIWAYKNIHLKATDDGIASADGSSISIVGDYGDEVYTKIEAVYNDGTESNFGYSIAQADIDKLGEYGLGVTNAGDYFKISGQLTKVTPDSGVSITISVTDSLAIDDPATPDIDERVSQYVVTVISSPREVYVDTDSIMDPSGSQEPFKPYNGTKLIPVKSRVELVGVVEFTDRGKDNVYLTVDGNALLDDANAGTLKNITLTNVYIDGDADKVGNYVLTGVTSDSNVYVTGKATVYARNLSIGIKLAEGSSDTVLFGEATPEYVVYLKDSGQLDISEKQKYDALGTDQERMSFIVNRLGSVSFKTDRGLYSNTGTYTISPVFNSTGKNYAMAQDSDSTSFTVGRDSGVMYKESTVSTANFRLSSEKGQDGFYPELAISAYGDKYNRIRLFYSSAEEIYPTMSSAEVSAMFSQSSVTVPDMIDGTVYIQMYSTVTGAVTETVTLSNMNVDTSGPVLDRYSVSPDYFYFNKLPFGSYFHSQTTDDGRFIDSMNITFEYMSEGSKCDSLFYSFVDEEGQIIGNLANQVSLRRDAITGAYKATVTVHPGEYGQLVVYATDKTGNKSVINKVKLDECVEYIKDNPVADGYYEWMVENTIESSEISVTSNDDIAVTDEWYNSLDFSVYAVDVESGVDCITWIITSPDGTLISETDSAVAQYAINKTGYGKVLEYTFTNELNDSELQAGQYTIEAVLKDNAGNTVKLDAAGPFLLDTKAPVIDDNTEYSDNYVDSIDIQFTVTEGENESGIESVILYRMEDVTPVVVKSWQQMDNYSITLNKSGDYIIEATDNAGNVSTHNFTLDKVSDVKPSEPVISIEGTQGNGFWYIEEKPQVTVSSAKETYDGVPVTTFYKIITDDREKEIEFSGASDTFELKFEGNVTIKAWAVSASGIESETAVEEFAVDIEAPSIHITEASADNNGDTKVSFRIIDLVSGVNPDKVLINGKTVDVEVVEDAVVGSFIATDDETYVIAAEDYAGNVAEDVEFKPLTIKVNPIIEITEDGAYLEAFINKGTYEIADAYISFREDKDSSYLGCLYNKSEESYGLHLDTRFEHLKPDTIYWYKIYAKTKTSNEIRVFEGSFKTTNPKATCKVYGEVTYGEGVVKTYPIYVSLYQGNTVVAVDVIEDETDSAYNFDNVNDGIYRVVATNGEMTKTGAVTVENGGVSYPADFGEMGGVNFVLNSMSTTVVIKDNAVNLSADGLEKIYDTTWFERVITPEDKRVLDEGGSVNICLLADNISVSEISPEEQSIFSSKLGDEAVIERYIQLYIIKEVRDANNKLVNGTPTYVNELYDPITISFPLGDLAGQNIYVASVHNNGSDYTFINWSNNLVASKNFVTITTKHFSVYALYRLVERPNQYTVKWVDGNGNVMKTDTVLEGSAAVPPTEIPTKKATDKYTYTFSGWDTDYSKITKDTTIVAWFTAKEIPSSNQPDKPDKPGTPDTDVKPGDNNNNNSNNNNNNNDYSYMGSGSPNTGDATPVMMLAVMFIISGLALFLLKKNKNEYNE